MMENNYTEKYNKISKIIMINVFALITLSIYNYFIVSSIGGIFYCVLLYLNIFILCIDNKRIYYTDKHSNKIIVFYFAFSAIYILYFQFIYYDLNAKKILGINISSWVYNLIFLTPIIILAYFLLRNKDKTIHKLFIKMILLFTTITLILSLKVLYDYPNAIRSITWTTGNAFYEKQGLGGFGFVYSIPIIIPTLIIFIFNNKGRNKFLYIAFLTLCIVFILKANFTLALIVSIISILLSLFFTLSGKIRFLFLMLILPFIILLIDKTLISDLLINLSRKFDSYFIKNRLIDLSNIILGNNNIQSERLILYNKSINAFEKSPIFGIFIFDKTYQLSEHSTMLDLLGGSGFIGTLPFILCMYEFYKKSKEYILNTKLRDALKASWIVAIIISFINPILSTAQILFFLLIFVPLSSNLVSEEE
jgi:hypothetical protein